MSTLTETAYYTRRGVIYAVAGLIAIFFIKILLNLGANYWRASHPPPPPPPNMAYGKLPYPPFPKEGKITDLTYRLETVTGNLPESSPSGRVYFMPILSANLLSFDRAKEKAQAMGFTTDPITLSPGEYLWTDPQVTVRTLKINSIKGNLTLNYDYHQDSKILQEKNLPTESEAINEAKNVLTNYGLFKDDLDNKEAKVRKLRFQGGLINEVGSLSEADFVQVQFVRSPQDNFPVLTPRSDLAPISIILSGSQDAIKRIIALDFNYQLIDRENFATYPFRTVSLAWEELKKGEGYVADKETNQNKEIVIRNIYPAYFDSLTPQTYLEPVLVFEGDNNFRAYIPAIDEKWLEVPPK